MKKLVVVGGGIVGLATALQCRRFGGYDRITVLEKESRVATHQSMRNSGVLHCGLYYQPGSLKARLAVEGLQEMLLFCRSNQIEHEVCGKLVLATDAMEEERLRCLAKQGQANGLQGLRWVERSAIAEYEPYARGVAALHVPQEGIVDYAKVAQKMSELLMNDGCEIRLGTKCTGAKRYGSRQVVETPDGEIETDHLVTCAGLHSDRVARQCGDGSPSRIVPFRGDYYELTGAGRDLVRNLIYPVPDPTLPFLGVHFTRKINGGVEAGPNAVLAFKREGYQRLAFSLRDAYSTLTFPGFYHFLATYPKATWSEFRNAASKRVFLRNLRRLVPDVALEHLKEGNASGVRAQAIDRDGTLAMDFRLTGGDGRIHVINAPSPAATASLAIGRHIAAQLGK